MCISVCVCAGFVSVDVCAGKSTCRRVLSVYVCGQLKAQVGVSDCVWRLCACDRRTGRDVYVSGICACPVNKSDPIRIRSISAPKR